MLELLAGDESLLHRLCVHVVRFQRREHRGIREYSVSPIRQVAAEVTATVARRAHHAIVVVLGLVERALVLVHVPRRR